MAGVQPRAANPSRKLRRATGAPFKISRSCQPKATARAHGQSSPALCQAPLSSRSIARRTVRVPASR